MAVNLGATLVAFTVWLTFAFATSEIATSLGWVNYRIGARLYSPAVRPGRARFFDRTLLLFVAVVLQVLMIAGLLDPETSVGGTEFAWIPAVELLAAAAWIVWLVMRHRREGRPLQRR